MAADVSKTVGYAVAEVVKPFVSKTTGYAVLSNERVLLTKSTSYGILQDASVRVDKSTDYGILRDARVWVDKATGYAILRDRKVWIDKSTDYAVLFSNSDRIYKATNYAVLTGDTPWDVKATKFTGYVVGHALPVPDPIRGTGTSADALTGGQGQMQGQGAGLEALTDGQGQMQSVGAFAETLTGGVPTVYCSSVFIEVLCGVPEEPFMLDPATQQAPFSIGASQQLIGITMEVSKKPNFSTRVAEAVGGREIRNAFYEDPRWEYTIRFDYLPDKPAQVGYTQLKLLEGWFLQCRGSYASFLFKDPDDYTASNLQASMDDVTLTFPIMRNLGGFNERIGQIDTTETYEFWFQNTVGEAHTIPATPGPYTVTATNAATFRANVKVTSGDGLAVWSPVADTPGLNEYTVSPSGVYTFSALNEGDAVLIYYSWDLVETTDYTILMPNKIVFPVAPSAGKDLYGAFEFFFVCRFMEDMADFEKFMDKLWELQELSFKSVIQ